MAVKNGNGNKQYCSRCTELRLGRGLGAGDREALMEQKSSGGHLDQQENADEKLNLDHGLLLVNPINFLCIEMQM